jgi:hypothetical protein
MANEILKEDSTTSPTTDVKDKSIKSFTNISQHLTSIHFGSNDKKELYRLKPTKEQLKAFIQLRHPIEKFAKLKPIYKSLTRKSIPQLIDLCAN